MSKRIRELVLAIANEQRSTKQVVDNQQMLHVGDKVVVIKKSMQEPIMGSLLHRTGVVMKVSVLTIGIRFDQEIRGGHTLNGRCENGFGWYVDSTSLQKMEPLVDLIKKTFQK